MDPKQLAATVVSLLLPWAVKSGKEIIDAAGEVAYTKTKALVDKLKARWSGNEKATTTLEYFEEDPETFEGALTKTIERELEQDEAFAHEVKGMVDDLGPRLKILQEMDEGNDVTGLRADAFNKGEAEITQKIKKGTKITGADLGSIG